MRSHGGYTVPPLPPGFERRAAIATEDMQHRGIIERDRLAEGMAHPPRRRYRFCRVSIRLISIVPVPGEMGEVRAAKDADVRPANSASTDSAGPLCVRMAAVIWSSDFQLAQMKQAASQEEVSRQH